MIFEVVFIFVDFKFARFDKAKLAQQQSEMKRINALDSLDCMEFS